jgi:hypothetical protein
MPSVACLPEMYKPPSPFSDTRYISKKIVKGVTLLIIHLERVLQEPEDYEPTLTPVES